MHSEVESFEGESSRGFTLTCISCRMKFNDTKEQRLHYKSDLHRFNLKRKVANLPPVSQETFLQRANQPETSLALNNAQTTPVTQETTTPTSEPSQNQKPSCKICNKTYNTNNTLSQHLLTKKHLEKAKLVEEGAPIQKKKKTVTSAPVATQSENGNQESVESPSIDLMDTEGLTPEQIEEIKQRIKNAKRLTPEDCLFCNTKSADIEASVSHMAKEHGFFIPDIEYLKDLQGLIKYLGEKITIGHECLYCNGKGRAFHSTEAVQGHMRDLNHCKLFYDDNEEEYEEFYDFSRDYSNSTPSDPMVTDGETGATAADANNQIVPAPKGGVRVSETGCELIFQDGKTVGHRALKQYYQQRVRAPDMRDSVIINSVVNQYRLLGWTGSTFDSVAARKRQDAMHEKKALSDSMWIGIKANKLMRHFRKQMLV